MTEASQRHFRVAQEWMVRGIGQFLDDVKLPGMCHAAFVRSPHAHARITQIRTDAALRIPGAIAVLAPEDLLPHTNAVRPGGFCRKVRFFGKIQKLGVWNSRTYRLPNSLKSNFATEPKGETSTAPSTPTASIAATMASPVTSAGPVRTPAQGRPGWSRS